jgi:hypothetical protein
MLLVHNWGTRWRTGQLRTAQQGKINKYQLFLAAHYKGRGASATNVFHLGKQQQSAV